jgi:hypothetical protein
MSASSVPSPSDSPQLVLDTWPVMEWLKDRKRAADYFDLLLAKSGRSAVRLFMSRINLGEVYYLLDCEGVGCRAGGCRDGAPA